MITYATDTNPEHDEIWRTYEAKAIADIQSHFKITKFEAEIMLKKSDINHPVVLPDVAFWIEL